MKTKTIYLLVAAAMLVGGATAISSLLMYKPCFIKSSSICHNHLKKLGDKKDAEDPYILSFTTAWLAEPAKILYPAYARDQGFTGVTKLELRVDADGKLMEKSISESSGHAILDNAALAATDTFVFNPAGFGNVLFPYYKELIIRFELDEGKTTP
jgi:TonB family protein